MKHLYNSNILDVTTGFIVHGCNAQSVMGSGVAKQLRSKYPDIYTDYVEHLRNLKLRGQYELGTVCYTKVTPSITICNAITQRYYGNTGEKYVSYEAISAALQEVVDKAKVLDMEVHVPYLIGAGLGGGDEKLILEIFDDLEYNNICFHHFNK